MFCGFHYAEVEEGLEMIAEKDEVEEQLECKVEKD